MSHYVSCVLDIFTGAATEKKGTKMLQEWIDEQHVYPDDPCGAFPSSTCARPLDRASAPMTLHPHWRDTGEDCSMQYGATVTFMSKWGLPVCRSTKYGMPSGDKWVMRHRPCPRSCSIYHGAAGRRLRFVLSWIDHYGSGGCGRFIVDKGKVVYAQCISARYHWDVYNSEAWIRIREFVNDRLRTERAHHAKHHVPDEAALAVRKKREEDTRASFREAAEEMAAWRAEIQKDSFKRLSESEKFAFRDRWQREHRSERGTSVHTAAAAAAAPPDRKTRACSVEASKEALAHKRTRPSKRKRPSKQTATARATRPRRE